MDSFDAAILEFARRWSLFGGPRSEDVLVEFGMTTDRYDEHLTRIHDEGPRDLPADERAEHRDRQSNNPPEQRRRPRHRKNPTSP